MKINLITKEVEVLEKRKKAYAVALMVVIMILPYNVKIDLRTDLDVIEWLYEYSKIGSVRRELDDKLYIYLNFINTILELININEYSLRWNYIPIEEAYRFWFKELTYNTISANGSNVLIDWSVSFKLINNEVTTPRNVNIEKMPRLDVLGIWICDKNDASDAEFVIFKDSIDEVLTNYTKEFDADKVKQFKECSFGQKSVLNEIFDVYMRILKGLKRKKKRVDDSDEDKNEGKKMLRIAYLD
ncbi:hypothetical protein RhiirC2_778309 [Rhizophagus irregularis]|uniref:Uncharacterized protein n=1 Tax=Rhizophagus irregularis TaxID=588596 RepID=A0A2N1NC87_9GLOM|nr:hypothetical protein RhiirC2_778309 [Rhizophagus irregularis]